MRKLFFGLSLSLLSAPFLVRAQWKGWQALEFESGLSGADLGDLTRNFMLWFLSIFGFIGIISFIVSGIQYLSAAGNEEQAEKAKKTMTWSIVGVAVGLGGAILIYAADRFLRGSASF